MRERLRVLTLNCWNVSEPYAARLAAIRAGIEALQPDLIGLQEIVVRRDGFDQGAEIVTGFDYHTVYGPAFRWNESSRVLSHDSDGDAFGNLIASRWPIRRSQVFPLPGAESGERRSAIASSIEAPFGSIAFVGAHLNWKFHHGAVRERQVLALADLVREWARDSDFPPVVVGDLNAEPDSNEVRFLCGLATIDGRSAYFQDAWHVAGDGPGFTWDNRNPFAAIMYEPNRRIDYILVGPADPLCNGRGWIEAAHLALDQPIDGVFPSDHFGVVADIRI